MKLENQRRRPKPDYARELIGVAESETVFLFDAEQDAPEEVKKLWKTDIQNRSGESGLGTHISKTFMYAVSLPRRKEDLLLEELSRKMQGKDFTQWKAAAFIPFLFPDRLNEVRTKLGNLEQFLLRQRAIGSGRSELASKVGVLGVLLLKQVFPEALAQHAGLLQDRFVEAKRRVNNLRARGHWGEFSEMAAYSRLAFPEQFPELAVSQTDWESSLAEARLVWKKALEPGSKHQGLTNAFALTVLSAGEVRVTPGSAVQIIPALPKPMRRAPLPERPTT